MWLIISGSNAPQPVALAQREDKKQAQTFLVDYLRERNGTMNKNKMSGFYAVAGVKIKLHIEVRKRMLP